MAVKHDRYPVVVMDLGPKPMVYLREVYMDLGPVIMPPWFTEDLSHSGEEEEDR